MVSRLAEVLLCTCSVTGHIGVGQGCRRGTQGAQRMLQQQDRLQVQQLCICAPSLGASGV